MDAVTIESLRVGFHTRSGAHPVIDSVDLTVRPTETFGIFGPSGCGKSTLLRVLSGVHRHWTGRIRLFEQEIESERRFHGALRREVQMVFQDPYGSLHPLHTVGRALLEPLQVHHVDDARSRMAALLEEVGLAPDVAGRYPHQLSGGQRQRVAIARAIGLHPRLLLLDEPTSALDLSTQAQILNLLNRLKAAHSMTLLLVSHDMDVIAHMCDRAAEMRAGRIARVLSRHELEAL
jgi:peptide/nickel transport system ATP-binding protein